MRRVARVLPLVLLCSALVVGADSARSLFNKGVQAEARQDYESAYEYYKQAYERKPTELKYRVPFERLRFMAAASKVHRGQKLREDGKLQEALAVFQEAASIDPSNDLAAQEIRRTQQMIQKQQGAPAPSRPRAEDDSLRQMLDEATGPVRLNGIPNTQLPALEMNNDTKVEYETIGKLANLNVLFDPDYQSRKLAISLRNVTMQEALDILALQSRTFWRPVTPNTIFVAADTQAKRRELEQNVIKTFYLGNVSSATDLQDIVNAIRTVLEVQRIQQIPSQNAIVIKGTPDQLALAQKMVDDIDKSKPEVVIDVIVAQVRRDKLRNIGILPPQNATVSLQGPNVATPTATPTGTPTTPNLNFNNIQHLNSTSYALTIDPVKAVLLFNDTDAKILQSPRIRASNGEKATLKVADRIPIATGSFGTPTGIGTAVGAVGVNTQFTYTDVGVIMDITPTVHPDGQVTLKTSLEISNLNGSSNIGGVVQPIISQRKEESVMRVSDGEINMLGGIYENQYTKTTSGTPFLGSIPVLKYIFSQENKEVITNEIVFLLIPHVVRGQELSDINRRAFDVGTGTSIDLRIAARPPQGTSTAAPGAPATPATSAPPAAANPATQPGTSAQPPEGNTSTPDAGSPDQVTLRLDPGNVSPAQGTVFNLNVVMAHGQDIAGVRTEISYDPNVLQLINVTDGGFLGKDGKQVPIVQRNDAATGKLVISAVRPPGSAGISGDGTVFNVTFLAKAKGSGVVSLAVAGATNSQKQPLHVQGSRASITVN